jgi:3D (Asp-Asp-Asp) domain-containing protein
MSLGQQNDKKTYIVVKQETIIENPRFETFEITAYTAGYESTQKHKGESGYGITASGKIVREHYTAACPPNLPFGTELFIPKLHTVYVCEDRGGAIKGNRIDIFVEQLSKAKKFGRRKLDVLVHIPRGQ